MSRRSLLKSKGPSLNAQRRPGLMVLITEIMKSECVIAPASGQVTRQAETIARTERKRAEGKKGSVREGGT